ncbi:MAG: PD-(D/E)XK nuclease family protein [candidate division WOR-3 bacterium]
MALDGKVKVIPIDQPFLRVLAEYFADKFRNKLPDFSDILIVFPSERNKFYFRRYLLESINKGAVIPPPMFTIEELIDFIYEKIGGERALILQTIERNFILKKTIDDLKIEYWREIPFLKFIAIGNRLLNFYDELSQERVSIEDIEKKSVELHFSERYIKNELPILRKVYQRYRENLQKSGYRDKIDQIEKIYQNFDSKIFHGYEQVIIAGIAAATSFERFIIKNMLESLNAEMILHSGFPREIASADDVHKEFYLHYKLLHQLGVDIPKIEVIKNISVPRAIIHIKSLETITKQTFYLAEVVRNALTKYPDAHRIGIVLTDEGLLFPVTEILNSYHIECNISAGLPFTNLIFYSFLKHLYEAVNSNFHCHEFFTFIQHPLIKNAIIENTELRPLVYVLRKKMIQENQRYFLKTPKFEPQLMLEEIGNNFSPLINFLNKCFSTVEEKLPFDKYIANLIILLNELLSYNQDLINKNFPGIKEFFERLHNLSYLKIEEGAIPPGIGTLEFILKVLQDERYHIEGEPLRGIQLIGLLEARNLDFDCIILPSMNEGIFPKKSEKDIFINPGLRKAIGLITEEERNSLYYYYFLQLTRGKKEVFISYLTQEEMDIPSRFLMNHRAKEFREDSLPVVFLKNAMETKEREVKKDDEILKALFRRIKDGLSHTLLKCYKSCPYQFYLKYLLEITEPKEITETFDALTWGSLFHSLAKDLYQKHYPKGYSEEQRLEVVAKVNELLDQYLNSSKYVALPPKPEVYFDIFLYKRFLENFVNYEIKRFKEGYMIHPGFEESFLKDVIEVDGKMIPLIGFVDRIDTKDGLYYIIDYKTGNLPASKEYAIGEDFIEFQLPIYALMFAGKEPEKIGGLFYYNVGKKTEIKSICEKEAIADYLFQFQEKVLTPVINEMLDPEVPFYQTENGNFCIHCAYKTFCGRQRWRE